ncbi:T4S1 protein, partial [Pheucticus melanocephalus]|nr:T4S1 protein [Pheucticus melanocephalus]
PCPRRTAMCVGKCSRIVGPCLLVLGTLSVLASILLLFPGGASRYLLQGHLGRQARALPGLWGGGIAVSTAGHSALPAGTGPRSGARAMGRGRRLPLLALLGAAACFVLCGVGLRTGPLCLHNSTAPGPGHAALWGYPFRDPIDLGAESHGIHVPFLSRRVENYLYNRSTWSTCLEPEGIVTWHVALFSLLLLISAAEMLLALLQILNGLLGCLCG